MSYQQVGNKTLRQLNIDNAVQHGTHSGADAEYPGQGGEPEVRGFALTTATNVSTRVELLSALQRKFEPNVPNGILRKVAEEVWRERMSK